MATITQRDVFEGHDLQEWIDMGETWVEKFEELAWDCKTHDVGAERLVKAIGAYVAARLGTDMELVTALIDGLTMETLKARQLGEIRRSRQGYYFEKGA